MTNLLKLIPALYAFILFSVTVVEDAFDGVPGPQKKTEAVAQLKAVLTAAKITLPAFVTDELLGTLVDVVVAVLNKVGTFRHTA